MKRGVVFWIVFFSCISGGMWLVGKANEWTGGYGTHLLFLFLGLGLLIPFLIFYRRTGSARKAWQRWNVFFDDSAY